MRPVDTFDHISLCSSEYEKCSRQTLQRKSTQPFCAQELFFLENRVVYEIM